MPARWLRPARMAVCLVVSRAREIASADAPRVVRIGWSCGRAILAAVSELLRLLTVGLLGGAVLFAVLLVPAILHQRRRFGQVRPRRLLGLAIICLYSMTLVGLTLAPAYDVAVTCRHRIGGVVRLDPVGTVSAVMQLRREGASWAAVATSFPVMQAAMNTALFVPTGLILRGMLRWDAVTSVAAGMMLSAAIEVTQYTGAWGLYPCGVRIADIEDLLWNTVGVAIGALVGHLLARGARAPYTDPVEGDLAGTVLDRHDDI